MIDSPSALKAFIGSLPDLEGPTPCLYIDLEGNNLSRKGTLSLVTILVEPRHTVHLVDVTGLGKLAFHTAGPDGKTLKHILESQEIVKVFFDIRNDSDALFGLFDIRVKGIEDIQLMELASRGFQKRHVNGLAKCIERDSNLPFAVRREWRASKERGHKLFDPDLGGGYAVFDERPLSAEIQKYCVQDVIHMPALRELYRAKLCDAWWRKIEAETLARIKLSQGRTFNGQGMHMAKAPIGWEHFRPSLAERQSRVLLIQRRDSAATVPATAPASVGRVVSVQSGATTDTTSALLTSLEALSLQGSQSGHSRPHSDRDDFAFDDRDDFAFDDENDFAFDDARDFTACDSECGYCGSCDY